jgi:hypothetical protein
MVPCSACFRRSERSIWSHADFVNGADRSEPINRTSSRADECGSLANPNPRDLSTLPNSTAVPEAPLRISLSSSLPLIASGCAWPARRSRKQSFSFNANAWAVGQLAVTPSIPILHCGHADDSDFLTFPVMISSESAAPFGNSSAHRNHKLRNGKAEFKENKTDAHEEL